MTTQPGLHDSGDEVVPLMSSQNPKTTRTHIWLQNTKFEKVLTVFQKKTEKCKSHSVALHKLERVWSCPKRLARARRRVFLEEIPEPHHRKMVEPSHRWRKRHATFGKSLPKTERGPFVKIQAIHGHSGASIQSKFFSQQILELGHATELYHIRFAKSETAIEEKKARTWRLRSKTKVDKHAVNPWTKNPNKKHKAHTHFKSHHDAIYVVEGRRAGQ